MAVKLSPAQSATDPDQTFLGVKVSHLEEALNVSVFREIVAIVAQRYVDAHYAEIVAELDQRAIANLAVAGAAKKIAEEIQRRPTVITVAKGDKVRMSDDL